MKKNYYLLALVIPGLAFGNNSISLPDTGDITVILQHQYQYLTSNEYEVT